MVQSKKSNWPDAPYLNPPVAIDEDLDVVLEEEPAAPVATKASSGSVNNWPDAPYLKGPEASSPTPLDVTPTEVEPTSSTQNVPLSIPLEDPGPKEYLTGPKMPYSTLPDPNLGEPEPSLVEPDISAAGPDPEYLEAQAAGRLVDLPSFDGPIQSLPEGADAMSSGIEEGVQGQTPFRMEQGITLPTSSDLPGLSKDPKRSLCKYT